MNSRKLWFWRVLISVKSKSKNCWSIYFSICDNSVNSVCYMFHCFAFSEIWEIVNFRKCRIKKYRTFHFQYVEITQIWFLSYSVYAYSEMWEFVNFWKSHFSNWWFCGSLWVLRFLIFWSLRIQYILEISFLGGSHFWLFWFWGPLAFSQNKNSEKPKSARTRPMAAHIVHGGGRNEPRELESEQ